MSALTAFHPAIAAWFEQNLGEPTGAQAQAWPAVAAGQHCLIAAPTGSGKTLAAFLSAIDDLLKQSLAGELEQATQVLYVSPLKALSNDVQKNLQHPLEGVRARLTAAGTDYNPIEASVRSGDTPQSERARMKKNPPHILVTTPESLYLLLTSESGREMLSTVKSVIVDEIHAIAGSKRGAHLLLSLERLDALCGRRATRIGLSATQKPIEAMASFLTGNERPCHIVDTGHIRERELRLELPESPLTAIMSGEVWAEIYDRVAHLAQSHKTTLIFVNTRRLSERLARHLAERLGEDTVTAHHGSLSREHRLEAEQRLKSGELKALVATASLELGIDIGDVDLVCQIGSPRSIAAFLQRVGRSGHSVGALPKGCLFPLSRDDLVESVALIHSAEAGELDAIRIPPQPLDVLAQQVVAEVAARGECEEQALYKEFRQAWSYRDLTQQQFGDVLTMLAEGYATQRGRRGAYLHRDGVNAVLRPRRGARLTAITCGGAIPDHFDYDVIMQPQGFRVGSLNEDFAFDSLPGDVFQLGNTSYRILKVESGRVFVEDAKGQPPTLPFWFGEAPGRTDELSTAVAALRSGMQTQLEDGDIDAAREWLMADYGVDEVAARQLADYLGMAHAALGALPTQDCIILERFFDEVGDMHLVIHSTFGSRLNRAWGLALRKRFCRKFNFELQAAALEDSIVLSLGPTHSFALDEVAAYVHSNVARDVLTQALLDAPLFGTHWRWNASIALAVKRRYGGKRAPAQFQRSDAEDLLAITFPDQLACAENLAGKREIPDHPLVVQTLQDCLCDAMDINGLEAMLKRLEAGQIQVLARDLAAPSPLSEEVINAKAYAFLDDGEAEERRTRSIRTGADLTLENARALGQISHEVIERVREEAWPEVRDSEELHDALVVMGYLTAQEGARGAAKDSAEPGLDLDDSILGWAPLLDTLITQRRATVLSLSNGTQLWVAAERLAEMQSIYPPSIQGGQAGYQPNISPAPGLDSTLDPADTTRELLRSRLEGLGVTTEVALAESLGISVSDTQVALIAMETEGFVVRGNFSGRAGQAGNEWCERRLLARMHRYTIKRKRAEVEPVSAQAFMQFLFDWHGLGSGADGGRAEGEEALAATVAQLEGYAVAAGAWEADVLSTRITGYLPDMLDKLCTSGRVMWLRLGPPQATQDDTGPKHRTGPLRSTPITLLERRSLPAWRQAVAVPDVCDLPLSPNAEKIWQRLQEQGASFFSDLVMGAGLLRSQVEDALGELCAWGLVTADSFSGLRALITPSNKRPRFAPRTRIRRRAGAGVDAAGRWAPLPLSAENESTRVDFEALEHIAWVLLQRYGVIFKRLLEREQHLPPWRDLLYVYRRLEARGEIRGGRFIDRFAGEQFALPEAVGALRKYRHKADKTDDALISISAADPLNLVGIVIPGERVPAITGNRILFRNGVPAALQVAGQTQFLEDVDGETEWALRNQLLRRQPASYLTGSSMQPQHRD